MDDFESRAIDATLTLSDSFQTLLSALSALTQLAEIDPAGSSEHEFFAAVLRALGAHEDFSEGSVYVLEEDGPRCVARLQAGSVQLTDTVMTDNEAHLIALMRMAAEEGRLLVQTAEHGDANPVVSMSAPLRVEHTVVALINISSAGAAAFTLWHQRLLALVADLTGHLLANLRLVRRLDELVQVRTRELREALARSETLENRYRELALIDDLTGLRNRRYFVPEVRRAIQRARRQGSPLALVVIDIDHFKKINDRYGHETGDLVLRRFAMLMQDSVRGGDYLARWGGEEFVVALDRADCALAVHFSERLRLAVRNMELHPQMREFVTISAGIAELEDDLPSDPAAAFDELIRRADIAMYQCKNSGRDRTICYVPPTDAITTEFHP